MVLSGQENWDDGASDDSFGLGPVPMRRGVKTAWQGGTKADEENFLRMQQDYLRVMKQFNDAEMQRKQLAAKLARAEDAAKRMLVRGDKSVKGGAAARMLEMEGELQVLNDENTQLRHKLARERKAVEVLKDRNKELDLQVRKALADYQRLLRANKNPRNSRGMPGRPSGETQAQAHEEEEMRRRFAEQQEELAALGEENEYLRARLNEDGVEVPDGPLMGTDTIHLQQQVEELRRQLSGAQARAMINTMSMGGTGTIDFQSPGKGAALAGGNWELHELECDGQVYLLDPKSKTVFSRPTDPQQWPHPIGKLVRDDPVEMRFRHRRQAGSDFFTLLNNYLKGERKRLRDVFNLFDKDDSGSLGRRELSALAKELAPAIQQSDVRYMIGMLDADGEGAVTYEELMSVIAEVVQAGQAAKDAHSKESLQVLSRLRDALSSRAQEIEDAFQDADVNGDGVLDFQEIGRLFRQILPSLTQQELRYLLAKVHQWDVDGSGTISLAELNYALQVGSWSNVSGGLSRRGSSVHGGAGGVSTQLQRSIGGQQLQSEVSRLHSENLELKREVAILSQQGAEVSVLRRDLEEARLQAETVEDKWLRADPSTMRRSVGVDVGAELQDAWAKVKELRQRWLDAKGALDALRTDYTTVVTKLDEVHKQLNEERKSRFRMEKDKEFWRMEATKYRELEPSLDQARRKIADLETENRKAFSEIFHAPEGAMTELKQIKQELLEVRKAKATSEAREAEARKELARLRGMETTLKPGEISQLRADKQRLERELSTAKVDLEAVMARMAIYDRGASNGAVTPASLGSPREGQGLSEPESGQHAMLRTGAGVDVYLELRELRNVWHEDKRELDKTRKLLETEEEKALALQAQLEEMRSYYESDLKDKEKRLADTGRLGHRQVERLEERIRKLEAQLRSAYSQGWKAGGVRSSIAGGSVAVDLEEELADLQPDENIFELHMASAVLDEDAMGRNPPTFLSLDFFEHETQATSVISSGTPEYDHTVQYVLTADSFFVEYLDTKTLVIELNRSKGWDFETVGTARISLQQCLDDFRLGAGVGRNRQYHYTDIKGPGGRYLGRLRWAAGILKPIDKVLREYRQAAAAKKSLGLSYRPLDDNPAAKAIKMAASDSSTASHLKIVVKGCRGLAPNVAPSESTPYVGYTFPGAERAHFTTFGKGVHPVFQDEMVLPIVRTRELEAFLSRAELEFEVFDDADRSTGDSSILGVATVQLQELAEGLPVEGLVPLYSAQGRQRRGDVEILVAWCNPLVVVQPPGGADRGLSHMQRPHTGTESGQKVRVSRDAYQGRRPATGRPGNTSEGMSLRTLANQPRPVDDPDELRSIDGMSEQSDLPMEAEEVQLRRSEYLGTLKTSLPGFGNTMTQERTDLPTRTPGRTLDFPRRSLNQRLSPKRAHESPSARDPRATTAKRYGQVDESLDMSELPLVRDLSSHIQSDWRGMADHNIIVHIESVRLGAEVFRDPRVSSVFVMYEFLPDYTSADDQVTSTHPKTSLQMDFNYCSAIGCGHTPELHRHARYAIGQLLRTESQQAFIPFCLVSDTDDDDGYHEFGFAEVSLHRLLAQGDMISEEVDVFGQNPNETIATLKLTIIAQKALQSIVQDLSP